MIHWGGMSHLCQLCGPPKMPASGWECGCQTQWYTLFSLKGHHPWGTGTLNNPHLLITHKHPKATSLVNNVTSIKRAQKLQPPLSTPLSTPLWFSTGASNPLIGLLWKWLRSLRMNFSFCWQRTFFWPRFGDIVQQLGSATSKWADKPSPLGEVGY